MWLRRQLPCSQDAILPVGLISHPGEKRDGVRRRTRSTSHGNLMTCIYLAAPGTLLQCEQVFKLEPAGTDIAELGTGNNQEYRVCDPASRKGLPYEGRSE
jgi:hypothetical protein